MKRFGRVELGLALFIGAAIAAVVLGLAGAPGYGWAPAVLWLLAAVGGCIAISN